MTSVKELVRPGTHTASPDESVYQAAQRMEALGAACLPVVDRDDRLLGLLTVWDVHRAHPNRLVTDAMTHEFIRVSGDASLWEAYEIAVKAAVEHLPVMDGPRLVGMISRTDLAVAVARLTDALTGLPTSDYARHQIRAIWQTGKASSLIFIDLNQFGAFNKQHGHAAGDHVLFVVASIIKWLVDPQQDSPCRYGGDEFAIVTTRTAPEARELANRLVLAVRSATEREGLPVSVSAGVAAGRRRSLRTVTQEQVTRLINLASRASTEAKRRSE